MVFALGNGLDMAALGLVSPAIVSAGAPSRLQRWLWRAERRRDVPALGTLPVGTARGGDVYGSGWVPRVSDAAGGAGGLLGAVFEPVHRIQDSRGAPGK